MAATSELDPHFFTSNPHFSFHLANSSLMVTANAARMASFLSGCILGHGSQCPIATSGLVYSERVRFAERVGERALVVRVVLFVVKV